MINIKFNITDSKNKCFANTNMFNGFTMSINNLITSKDIPTSVKGFN
jgi:hypothetical protein